VSASSPGHTLTPGKTRYPLYRRLGGSQGRSGQVRKISPPQGFDPRTVQPVGSRYTSCATRPTGRIITSYKKGTCSYLSRKTSYSLTLSWYSSVTLGKYHSSASNLATISFYISIPKYAVNCSFYHAPRWAVTTELRTAFIEHYTKPHKSKILCVKM
jgi:hypothetical protein